MSVLIRWTLLLIVVPLVELVLLLTLADLTGFTATIALVVATGFAGAWLLRRQGWKTLGRIRAELNGGRLPSAELLDGVLILMAGALLLTPGILTDLLGIALLVPWTRSVFRSWLLTSIQRRWRSVRFSNAPFESAARSSEVIDSYVVSPGKKPDR